MEPEINLAVAAGAALIPMIVGAIFYGPLFGRQWMDSLGFKESSMPEPIKMPIVYALALLMSFILAYFLPQLVEHAHRGVNDAGVLVFTSDHTFKHGAFHGVQFGAALIIPVLISNLLFQRNSAKNILLNVVYWLVTLALVGGVMDAFS